MKTATLLHKRLLAACTCLLLGMNTTLPAQDTANSPNRQITGVGFDIEIADGMFTHHGEKTDATLENVLNMLRERHQNANIIVAPEVPSILIENLKIRATDLSMELEALQVASGRKFNVNGSGSRENPLYVLEAVPEMRRDGLRVEAFSLGGYFASLPMTDNDDENEAIIHDKVAELEKMVDETVAIYGDFTEHMYGRNASRRTSLNMRFHRGANLVILIGDPDSIEIAGKVIGALPHVQRSGGAMGYGDYGVYGRRGSGFGQDLFEGGGGTYGSRLEAPATTPQPRR